MKEITLKFTEAEYNMIKAAAGRSGKSIRGFILDVCRQLEPEKRGRYAKNISHVSMERGNRLPSRVQRMPKLYPGEEGKKKRV